MNSGLGACGDFNFSKNFGYLFTRIFTLDQSNIFQELSDSS